MSDERHETVADNVSANHQFREVEKMIQHEEVAVSKMETTTPTSEKSSAVGNEAAMREALEEVRFYLPHLLQYMRLHWEDAEAGGYYGMILEVVNAALAKPPSNCDVGTPLEQYKRFDKICSARRPQKDCPLFEKTSPCCSPLCFARWSQMPYDEEQEVRNE